MDGPTEQLPGLTDAEQEILRKVFSSPLDIPAEWKAWLIAYLEANPPDLPINQSIGFVNLVASAIDNANTAAAAAQAAADAAQDSIFTPVTAVNETETPFTSTTFATITGGPHLSGLDDGTYVVWFGCAMNVTGGDTGYMAVSANGGAASDFLQSQVQDAHVSVSRVVVVTLSAGDGLNTIDGVYKCTIGHANDQSQGFVTALRTS